MKQRTFFILLFTSFVLVSFMTLWLFILPMVSYGFGRSMTICQASKTILTKWHQMIDAHHQLSQNIEDHEEDIKNIQRRSFDLQKTLDQSKYKHEDMDRVKELNYSLINQMYAENTRHSSMMGFAETLSEQVLSAKGEMEKARMRNLCLIPEGAANRFHGLEQRLYNIQRDQQQLITLQSDLLNSTENNLNIFKNQVSEVVNNSAYFKFIKDSFEYQQIAKTVDGNNQIQAKIIAKQKHLLALKQQQQEDLILLKENIQAYKEMHDDQLEQQKERIRDNNNILKDRMQDQRDRLESFREHVKDSREKMKEIQESFKEKMNK